MLKNIIQCLLTRDLCTCDFSKDSDNIFEIFGNKVAWKFHTKSWKDTKESFVSSGEGIVMPGIGNDNRDRKSVV